MARITDRQVLHKDMLVKQNNGIPQVIRLTSDPYEQLKGEWFVNTELKSDPTVTETLYLPLYGIDGTFSSRSLETL